MNQIIGFVAVSPNGDYLPIFVNQNGDIYYLDLTNGFYALDGSSCLPVYAGQPVSYEK